MKPYYQDSAVTIYHGDCREIVPTLGRYDLLLTDPPYSSGGFQEAGKSAGSIGTRSAETIALDNLSSRGYQRLMREVLRGAACADEAYIFTDWKMWVYTFDALEDAGMRVRNMLVWDKTQMGMGMPWRNQHELIAYAKRTPCKIMDGKRGNVIQCKRSGNTNHPTEKPVNLLRALIGNTDAQTILDPFAGSCTTGRAAKDLGRKAVLIEREERYCEIGARRMAQEVLPLYAAMESEATA